MVARVQPDVAGIDKQFDYLVPDEMAGRVMAGSEVRVDLAGRRVGGWVVQAGPPTVPGLALRPLAKVRGHGPEPELVDLAGWAAWRWAGRRRDLFRTSSAGFAVPSLPAPDLRKPARPDPAQLVRLSLSDLPLDRPTVLRLPPAADPTAVVAELAQLGPTLVVVPSIERAGVLAGRLRRGGAAVALIPRDWPQARAGVAVVIGSRGAAWAPCPELAAAVVIDGHDESLSQEQAPTWNAVAVVAERARRARVPCAVISACPGLELLSISSLRTVEPATERRGWARIEILDRRGDDPRVGLYSAPLVTALRAGPRVVCVLNRTGRAKLLACGSCGALARCERCGAAVGQDAGGADLTCPRCGLTRPRVCSECNSTRLKLLRVGVTRVREELEALVGRPVVEVTGASPELPAGREVLVGTEAVLHRLGPGDGIGVVAFLDFDQELLAPRVRAGGEALALLAHASRLVRGRDGRILVQTRTPDHPALRAALLGDPELLTAAEAEPRRALGFPPFMAVAVLSGPGSGEYAAGLAAYGVTLLGPDGDRWLAKADNSTDLANALGSTPRPAARVRVEVDPARL